MKKAISITLLILLCLSIFAGCQSAELGSYSEDAGVDGSDIDSTGSALPTDYTPCFEAYPADQVMLSIDGRDITWAELFYWYSYDVMGMESYGIVIENWDEPSVFDPNYTYRQYIMENAMGAITQYSTVMKKAKELGVELSDEAAAELDALWQSNVDNFSGGDEEAFIEYLSKVFLNKELYQTINRASKLYESLQEELFGTDGAKIDEAQLVEKAESMDYLHMKHILFSTVDESGAPLSDELKAEKKAKAEAILAQLKGLSGTALDEKFTELMLQNSEDPGIAFYTDGYCYIKGKMVAPVEEAMQALDYYGMSDVVESTHGYHIILRLPLKRADVVSYLSDGTAATLGHYIAQEMYYSTLDSWTQEAKVVTTDAYDKLDLAEVFAKAVKG